MKTHLVSQVILKEFTDDSGRLTINYKDPTQKPELKTTKDASYVKINAIYIERLEREWNETVENDTKKTLRVLRNGDVLIYEKHVHILRKLMSLHYIRSWALIDAFNTLGDYHINKIIEEVAETLSKDRESVLKLVEPSLPKMLGETLVNSLDDLIKKVDIHISNFGIEVGVAPEGSQFVLSDSPTMTMDRDGNMGIKQGVGILRADEVAMVMTPRHIVALKSGTQGVKYIPLTSAHVDEVNRKQIAHSLREYYSVPEL